MIAEYDFRGVYIASAPVTAIIALTVALVIHRLLVAVGAYRWVWHPVLFDSALFVVVWALLVVTTHAPLSGFQP